jgi:hypothetical protein
MNNSWQFFPHFSRPSFLVNKFQETFFCFLNFVDQIWSETIGRGGFFTLAPNFYFGILVQVVMELLMKRLEIRLLSVRCPERVGNGGYEVRGVVNQGVKCCSVFGIGYTHI